jgi:hypothetical protein
MYDYPSGTFGATEWAREMARLRVLKPRPLHKRYGKNPTQEQLEAHRAEERAWSKLYRVASKEQKMATAEKRW